MTIDEFWRLIALLDRDRIEDDPEGHEEPVTEGLVEVLSRSDASDIEAFDDILSERLYELDGQAFAFHAGVCGEFEDLFLYCRCCAVASGREAFESIASDPSLMPAGMEFEPLLQVAERAFRTKTGRDYEHVPAFSLEKGANAGNWPA